MKPFLTIFTPAYNRAYTLPRLYESLCQQSCKDFIWLVVDDGSADDTAKLIKGWQQIDNGFEIRYIYKENGGMHTAHNTAYANIDTELNVCIDSDDAAGENAVQLIYDKWNSIDKMKYAGLLGLDADFNGKILGTNFPPNLRETTLDGFYDRGGKGDKKLVLRTDVVKKYPPYPVFDGEKFISLGLLYSYIDRDYQLCVLNEVVCNVEYMTDGSTNNMFSQYYRNPKGFRYCRIFSMPTVKGAKRKIILYTHYIAESMLAKQSIWREAYEKRWLISCYPLGIALYWYILFKNKKEK